jgi:hypothetical protein
VPLPSAFPGSALPAAPQRPAPNVRASVSSPPPPRGRHSPPPPAPARAPTPSLGRAGAPTRTSSPPCSLPVTSSPSFFLRPRRRRLCQPPCAAQRAIPRPHHPRRSAPASPGRHVTAPGPRPCVRRREPRGEEIQNTPIQKGEVAQSPTQGSFAFSAPPPSRGSGSAVRSPGWGWCVPESVILAPRREGK